MVRTASSSIAIEGLVKRPPCGWRRRGGWELVVHLMPWRRLDGDPAGDELRLELPVSPAVLDAAMRRYATGTAVRVTLAQLRRPGKKPWWLGTGPGPLRRAKASPLLSGAGDARAQPVVVRDPELGRLVLDREYDWYDGRRRLDRRAIDLRIERSARGDDRAGDRRDLERARAAVLRIERNQAAIRRAIATKLVPLYNQTWRDDRPVLTADRLLAKIRPSSLVVHASGRATLYHRDGGLFLDHTVEVRLTARGTVREVCLAG